MSRAATKLPAGHDVAPHTFSDLDDYLGLDTTKWDSIQADTGATVTEDADGVGGVILLTTGATDNNEAYHYSNEILKIAANKPFEIEARIQYAEANTDDANVVVGVMDAIAANHLLDNGAGLAASFDGACIYKVDGETRWRVKSSNGTTKTDTETDVTAGGSSYQLLRIRVEPISSTEAEITFWIDASGGQNPVQCREYNANPRTPSIKHTVLLASMTEIALVIGVKAGDTNSEVVSVDYTQIAATR